MPRTSQGQTHYPYPVVEVSVYELGYDEVYRRVTVMHGAWSTMRLVMYAEKTYIIYVVSGLT